LLLDVGSEEQGNLSFLRVSDQVSGSVHCLGLAAQLQGIFRKSHPPRGKLEHRRLVLWVGGLLGKSEAVLSLLPTDFRRQTRRIHDDPRPEGIQIRGGQSVGSGQVP
jgi:hypothetical protein